MSHLKEHIRGKLGGPIEYTHTPKLKPLLFIILSAIIVVSLGLVFYFDIRFFGALMILLSTLLMRLSANIESKEEPNHSDSKKKKMQITLEEEVSVLEEEVSVLEEEAKEE
ncbi:hypothetical protein K9M78_00915 [Candidatus Bipolaricaulota bacterium]|nr:hypothetical protein [Candidatus Bipolaricaulota bacterium]